MSSPRKKLLTLDCELELSSTPSRNEGTDPSFHFAAVVKKATFNDFSYEIQESKQMADKLAKIITHAGVTKDSEFLNQATFAQALPNKLPSGIAVCYFGKFRDTNNTNKNDQEKIERAKKLVGTKLTLTLDPDNCKILLPRGVKASPTKEITKLKQNLSQILDNNTGSNKVEIVPLINFNADQSLLSLQLSEKDDAELLKYATEITGSVETAKPTNSEGNVVPFSFTIAKLPNLMPVCENILTSKKGVENKVVQQL